MAACDSEKKFTCIDAGFPGSAHDSRVFKSTELFRLMTDSPMNILPSTYYHLIGDSSFQFSMHLLVPFKDYGNLNHTKRITIKSYHKLCM